MTIKSKVEKLESRLEAPEGDSRVPLVLYGEVLMVPSDVPEKIEKVYGCDGDGELEAAA